MDVAQGEIYWAELGVPVGSGPGYRRPVLVVQSDRFNRTAIQTVVACIVTTNERLGRFRGNVVLEAGEANLPRRSVVNASQIVTIDKANLEGLIGALSPRRVRQILDGIQLVLEPA